MRKATFGERMAEFDRREDEAYWRRRFESTWESNDYVQLEALIQEALDEDYYIPYYQNSKIQEILKRLDS